MFLREYQIQGESVGKNGISIEIFTERKKCTGSVTGFRLSDSLIYDLFKGTREFGRHLTEVGFLLHTPQRS